MTGNANAEPSANRSRTVAATSTRRTSLYSHCPTTEHASPLNGKAAAVALVLVGLVLTAGSLAAAL